MKSIRILNSKPIDANLRIPGSKSITNRALVITALAEGRSILNNALFSDDTIYMMEALNQLGIEVRSQPENNRIIIDGGLSRIKYTSEKSLFLGNAGTAMRFLTAMLSLTNNTIELTGITRMKQRPIGELLSALASWGGDLYSTKGNGCPPVLIRGRGLEGGIVSLPGKTSSQFISALLLISPYTKNESIINIENNPVSLPYIKMTTEMMNEFGVIIDSTDKPMSFRTSPHKKYSPGEYLIESDASSASYFFAAAAVTGGKTRILGLSEKSIQGDIAFVRVLEKMGCTIKSGPDWIEVSSNGHLNGITADMKNISDTAQTLACVALFAEGKTKITGIANIRFKETDRILALKNELSRLGAKIEETDDSITIHPAQKYNTAEIETYDDHRMAMSFAVAGLKIKGITIKDHECVSKTFPDFFKVLNEVIINED